MKKINFFLAFTLLLLIFSSCTKNDDSDTVIDPSEDSILGLWQVTSIVKDGVTEDVSCGTILEFKETSEVVISSYNDDDETCVLDGVASTEEWKSTGTNAYTVTDNSKTLELEFSNNSFTVTIVDDGVTSKMTAERLELETPEDDRIVGTWQLNTDDQVAGNSAPCGTIIKFESDGSVVFKEYEQGTGDDDESCVLNEARDDETWTRVNDGDVYRLVNLTDKSYDEQTVTFIDTNNFTVTFVDNGVSKTEKYTKITETTATDDFIVGKWQMIDASGSNICGMILQFNEDGTTVFKEYEQDSQEDRCNLTSTDDNEKWSKIEGLDGVIYRFRDDTGQKSKYIDRVFTIVDDNTFKVNVIRDTGTSETLTFERFEESSEDNDPIIGTWKMYKNDLGGGNVEDVTCGMEVEFAGQMEFVSRQYSENSGNCELDSTDSEETWVLIGSVTNNVGTYRFTRVETDNGNEKTTYSNRTITFGTDGNDTVFSTIMNENGTESTAYFKKQ